MRATRKQRLEGEARNAYSEKFNEWLSVIDGKAKMKGRRSLVKLQRELDERYKRIRRVKR